MNKNTLIVTLGILTSLGTVSGVALAENYGMEKKAENMLENFEKHLNKLNEVKDRVSDHDLKKGSAGPGILVNPSGEARLTGADVVSVASSSATMTVKVWGKEFLVMANSDTKYLGGGKEVSLGDIKAGDKVDVTGKMMTESGHEGHIMARIMRDRSLISSERQEEVSRLRKQIEELIARLQKLLASSTATTTH